MHPNISAFPSAAFYQSRLTDGPNMDQKTMQTWHENPLFPPYAFYHVNGMETAGRHHSWTNPQEAQTALSIYDRLSKQYPAIDFGYRIGIVTPYKGQVGELKKTFRQRYGEEILSRISFNTVDVSRLSSLCLTAADYLACHRASKDKRKTSSSCHAFEEVLPTRVLVSWLTLGEFQAFLS